MNCQALMVRGSSPDKGVRATPHNSARSLRQDFCSNSKFRKWRNTVCISHFRNCGSGAKRRLRLADAIARCCLRKALNKSSAHGSCRFNQSFLKNREAPHTLTRSLIRDFCSNSNGKSGAKIRLIPVFNKTVKNRFIRLLFQQPAA